MTSPKKLLSPHFLRDQIGFVIVCINIDLKDHFQACFFSLSRQIAESKNLELIY